MTDTPNDREREEREDREAAEAEAAGPEAAAAYWQARCELAEERDQALNSKGFMLRVSNYKLAVELIRRIGPEEAMSRFIDEDAALSDAPEISDKDREWLIESQKDLVTAIDQGISLHEYLEFVSARSWLDREQSNDDDPDSNTGTEPERKE